MLGHGCCEKPCKIISTPKCAPVFLVFRADVAPFGKGNSKRLYPVVYFVILVSIKLVF